MAISWTIYIDDLEIEEPVGFNDLVIRAKRDEAWHGIFFEASTSELGFYGAAATYLQNKKFTEGFRSDVTFRAVATCGEEVDVLTGKLDFRQYKESCGNQCIVTMPVEQEGCTMVLRNRYDQKVDLTAQQTYNGTALPAYAGMNFQMTLPAQELRAAVEGYVSLESDEIDLAIFPSGTENFQVRPTYQREIYNNINEGQLLPTIFAASDNGVSDPILSPVLLLDEVIDCFEGEFSYEVRMKGTYDYQFAGIGSIDNVRLVVGYGDPEALTILHTEELSFVDDEAQGDFDFTFTGNVTLNQADTFYAYFENLSTFSPGNLISGNVTFEPETYVNLTANRNCPDTTALVSLIHETLSRVTEVITDRCLTVKSDYYGRTDSEPYAASADGCGSLRVVSSGLRVRNAPNPTHFLSLKDLFDGLRGIDNIGMGVEADELRIEPVEYFYQDFEIMKILLVPEAETSANPNLAYSLIKIGYKKWETEGINGLDEFNSNKEFRTDLSTIQNTLDAESSFIAGGYPIEITRQQSFAELGGADTKYDNDTFIICVERQAYSYIVEQGNIANAANFYSPATAYNWRIRPFYNLMRWWKSIAQSYPNITATNNKIYFSSGTGNLLAEGELAVYDDCKLENKVKAENDDLLRTDFNTLPFPLWRPDTLQFSYPFSLANYNTLVDNPYGYISVQCGTGEFVKAFITNLLYKPAKGEADLTLRLKWDTQY